MSCVILGVPRLFALTIKTTNDGIKLLDISHLRYTETLAVVCLSDMACNWKIRINKWLLLVRMLLVIVTNLQIKFMIWDEEVKTDFFLDSLQIVNYAVNHKTVTVAYTNTSFILKKKN